jgi:putative PEP-CTERM system TPR-repeat lipoprotein
MHSQRLYEMTRTLARYAKCRHLAAMLCLTLCLQACNRDTPEKLIASGNAYLAKRDYSAAAIQFKNAVQRAPNHAEARYLLGMTLEQEDEPGSAEIELRKAISAGYAPDLAYPALVRVLLEQRQFEKALSESVSQQSTNPAKVQLVAQSGDAQLGLGKLQEARAAYSAALSAEPSNVTATLGMAKVAALERDLPRANQLVDEVLARAPSSRDAVLLKGDLLLVGNHLKEAAQAYATAIQLRPQSLRVYLSLVPLLVRERDLDAARARVEAMKKFAPGAAITLYLDALVAHNQGDLERARDAIRASVQANPTYPPVLLLAGAIALETGSYLEAEQYLSKVISATPNQVYPRRLLVSTYLKSGQINRAQEALDALLQLAPDDPAVLTLAGEVALASRAVGKAAEYYQRALSRDPKNAQARTRLGEARLVAGDLQNAIQDLQAAASEDDNQYQADVGLVVLHLHRKELDKAEVASEALMRKQPNNPLTYILAGLVQLAKRDTAGGRKSFERALQLQPTYFPAAHILALLDERGGNPGAAVGRYEAILSKDAKNEQALLALIDALRQAGAPQQEIEKAIDRAVAANPQSSRARIIKIKYALGSGDTKGALSAAQQAHAALPKDLQVLGALGEAQMAAGERDQAIATFAELGSLMPKSAAPLLAQGEAYAEAKDWVSARQTIRKAVDFEPDLLLGRVALVRVEIQSGRFEEARADAQTIQKRWPTQPVGYLLEVDALIGQKEWANAERTLRNAIQKTKNPALVGRLYALLDGQGRKQEAEAVATNWAVQNPKDILVYTLVAQVNVQRKDYAAAARWYKSALKAQPNDSAILNNVAWVLAQVKDPAALDYGVRALALAPDSPEALDTVGWLYVERGDVVRGLELLNKAHILAPNASAIQLNLAKALIKAGQAEAARQQLELLAKLPTGSPFRAEAEKLLSSL